MDHGSIQSHIKVYRNVFIALMILTVLTVGVSYIHFNLVWVGVFVGLLIASVKGYLVAANFMHLNDESKTIYWILILTIAFLIVLFFMPMVWEGNLVTSHDTLLFDDLGNQHNHSGGH
tara:strand:- start:193 stop:546 length:354 start_codon:yes stop_codon:yes gene_type:complete